MRVALTFDCEFADKPGADQANTALILDILRERGVQATFFMQGQWAMAYPEYAKAIAEDGHLIGTHGHHHTPLEWLTREGFFGEVMTSSRAILRVTGATAPPWYRPPFGEGGDRFDSWLRELGFHPGVLWNVGSGDWQDNVTPEIVAKNVADTIQDGFIVLLHTWPNVTPKALPTILDLDAEFVTLEAFVGG